MEILMYSTDPATCDIMLPVLGDMVILIRSLEEAKKYISNHDVKAFLIDLVNTEEEDGLALAYYLRDIHRYCMTPLLFLAKDNQYVRLAYKEFRCYDYLRKPLSPYLLKDTLTLLCEKLDPDYCPKGIVVRLRSGIHRFEIKDITYVEILNKKLIIHTLYNVWKFPYRPIKEFLQQGRGELVQCHRSMAVNRQYVQHIDYLNRTIELTNSPDKVLLGPKYMEGIRKLISKV